MPPMDAALAAAATLVAGAFALATLERWLARRRRHELAWTLALACFALGSAALWAGSGFGWDEANFKVFYVAGAIVNVPVLAVGTVYLLGGPRRGDRAFLGVVVFSAFAAGWVLAAPLVGPIPPDTLPHGREVFGPVPRILAAVGSGVGATVLLGGAVWSAVRLLRLGRTAPPGAPVPPRRLAAANGLIAAGTLVLSAGGLLNGALGEMGAFSVSLVLGISLVFGGFLLTGGPSTDAPPAPQAAPWLHRALVEPLDGAAATADDAGADDGAERRDPTTPEAFAGLRGPRQN